MRRMIDVRPDLEFRLGRRRRRMRPEIELHRRAVAGRRFITLSGAHDEFRSLLLQLLDERGYIHQLTDAEGSTHWRHGKS
jgi:hypothetical protein